MKPSMTESENTIARIAILETEMKYLRQDVQDANAALKEVKDQGREVHELLLKGRGAWWMLLALAGVIGFLSNWAGKFIPLLAR